MGLAQNCLLSYLKTGCLFFSFLRLSYLQSCGNHNVLRVRGATQSFVQLLDFWASCAPNAILY